MDCVWLMAAFYDDQVVFMLQLLAPATNSVVWVPKDVWIYSYTLRGSFLCILAGNSTLDRAIHS